VPIEIAVPLVRAFEIYVLVGVVVGALFAFRFVTRLDPDAAAGSRGFRLLIWPGAALLWPWALWRTITRRPPPVQRDAHRSAARSNSAGTR
jgi:hypothetical protein